MSRPTVNTATKVGRDILSRRKQGFEQFEIFSRKKIKPRATETLLTQKSIKLHAALIQQRTNSLTLPHGTTRFFNAGYSN
jgi:hypothetical protein